MNDPTKTLYKLVDYTNYLERNQMDATLLLNVLIALTKDVDKLYRKTDKLYSLIMHLNDAIPVPTEGDPGFIQLDKTLDFCMDLISKQECFDAASICAVIPCPKDRVEKLLDASFTSGTMGAYIRENGVYGPSLEAIAAFMGPPETTEVEEEDNALNQDAEQVTKESIQNLDWRSAVRDVIKDWNGRAFTSGHIVKHLRETTDLKFSAAALAAYVNDLYVGYDYLFDSLIKSRRDGIGVYGPSYEVIGALDPVHVDCEYKPKQSAPVGQATCARRSGEPLPPLTDDSTFRHSITGDGRVYLSMGYFQKLAAELDITIKFGDTLSVLDAEHYTYIYLGTPQTDSEQAYHLCSTRGRLKFKHCNNRAIRAVTVKGHSIRIDYQSAV